jgi:hypothetical protein
LVHFLKFIYASVQISNIFVFIITCKLINFVFQIFPFLFPKCSNGFEYVEILNVHVVHDVRRMDIRTAEPLVPEPSLVEVEIAIGKSKRYKSLGTDQIPAELIEAGGGTL